MIYYLILKKKYKILFLRLEYRRLSIIYALNSGVLNI